MYVSELTQYINHRGGMSTSITRYPSGRYGIVGSMPIELTEERRSGYGRIRASMAWDTEQDVIDALIGIGLTHFQRADHTFYDAS